MNRLINVTQQLHTSFKGTQQVDFCKRLQKICECIAALNPPFSLIPRRLNDSEIKALPSLPGLLVLLYDTDISKSYGCMYRYVSGTHFKMFLFFIHGLLFCFSLFLIFKQFVWLGWRLTRTDVSFTSVQLAYLLYCIHVCIYLWTFCDQSAELHE